MRAPGYPLLIKTSVVGGKGSTYNYGVDKNGVSIGEIRFNVPASVIAAGGATQHARVVVVVVEVPVIPLQHGSNREEVCAAVCWMLGVLYWCQMDAPSQLFYVCEFNVAMHGVITVVSPGPELSAAYAGACCGGARSCIPTPEHVCASVCRCGSTILEYSVVYYLAPLCSTVLLLLVLPSSYYRDTPRCHCRFRKLDDAGGFC